MYLNNIHHSWYAWVSFPYSEKKISKPIIKKADGDNHRRVENILEVYDKSGKRRKASKSNFVIKA